MTLDLADELRALRTMKLVRDTLRQDYEEADRDFKRQQARVIERLDDAGVGSMKVDGVNHVPTKTHYAVMQDREAYVAWALAEAPELLEHRERGLDGKVRELLDDGEPLPPGVGTYTREFVSQRKA